jgi:hypothetical protein
MKRFLSIIGICACALFVHADSTVTIPLRFGYSIPYSGTGMDSADDPGSSTVDPVDPNQAKAELTGNTLKVYEGLEGEALISVYNRTNPQLVLHTWFDHSVTLTLTDTAQYNIQLSHPGLGTVYGTFRYPINNTRKVMQGGRLFILFGNHFYSPSGVKIQ